MNSQKIQLLIETYKQNFERINQDEIYKWYAVQRFQEQWDIDAPDFVVMVEEAFHEAKNLLDSQNYFPRRMLIENSRVRPEEIRLLFRELYDVDIDLLERIRNFKDGFERLNKREFPGKAPYQDHRAILVYLSLRFPNIYFLYKYEMFKKFVGLVDYPYKPSTGKLENIDQYQTMCELLRGEIVRDSELVKLNSQRFNHETYGDPEFHLLTQDVIYAATRHEQSFDVVRELPNLASIHERLVMTTAQPRPNFASPSLKGSTPDYESVQRERKQLGMLGELMVMELESQKLKSWGFNLAPTQVSVSQGDGLGYDILSFDENRKPLFIEVKTTRGAAHQPFFITRNELECSKSSAENYLIYRLYNFDSTTSTANYQVFEGDASHLCGNPILFSV